LTPKSDVLIVTEIVTETPLRNALRNTVTSRNSLLRKTASLCFSMVKAVTIFLRNCYGNMFVTRPRFLNGADCYGVTAGAVL
jgi:hypothetical protein